MAVRAQPRREIWLYGDKSASSALCLRRCHFYVSAREIDFTPIQSFYFSVTKSPKRANGEHWNNARLRALCRLHQHAQFIDREYLRWSVDQLWPRSERDRVKINHSALVCVTEQDADVSPVVCACFGRTRERAQPIIEFLNVDSGNRSLTKILGEPFEIKP